MIESTDWWDASAEECIPPLFGRPLGGGRGDAELPVASLGEDILKDIVNKQTSHLARNVIPLKRAWIESSRGGGSFDRAGSAAPSSYWGEKRDALRGVPVEAVLSAREKKEGQVHLRPKYCILIGSIGKRNMSRFSLTIIVLFYFRTVGLL